MIETVPVITFTTAGWSHDDELWANDEACSRGSMTTVVSDLKSGGRENVKDGSGRMVV